MGKLNLYPTYIRINHFIFWKNTIKNIGLKSIPDELRGEINNKHLIITNFKIETENETDPETEIQFENRNETKPEIKNEKKSEIKNERESKLKMKKNHKSKMNSLLSLLSPKAFASGNRIFFIYGNELFLNINRI